MKNLKSAAWLLFFFLVSSAAARADSFEFLPESRYQQYMTYSLFIEEEASSLLYRNAGRGWGAVGGSFALVEYDGWATKPQLNVFASANASFRLNSAGDTLLTETVDARVGLNLDLTFADDLRMRLGWTHLSGHISDDVDDKNLIGSNLGDEVMSARLIHDIEDRARVGGTLKVVVGSDPGMKGFASDQFVEWYPCGTSDNPKRATPYVGVGFEEYGSERVELTGGAQAGVYFGNHLKPVHRPTLRIAAGYYNGVDPRLKYAQFKFARAQFGYAGFFFDF